MSNNISTEMQAFIFGAGLGTRLRPLTDIRPKVTVPIFGKPVIFYTIEKLASFGIKSFIINQHYHGNLLEKIIGYGDKWGVDIKYSPEKEILETGGGVKQAKDMISAQTFIVYNGDIICDLDMGSLLDYHKEKDALVTLVVAPWCDPRQLNIDTDGRVSDIRNIFQNEISPTHTFLGIHIMEREIFDEFDPDIKKFSIIKTYLKLIEQKKKIYAYQLPQGYWYDIGSIEQYKKAHLDLMDKKNQHNSTQAVTEGYVAIGDNVKIEDNVCLKNTIIWDDVIIKANSRLDDCVVCDNVIVNGKHKDKILCAE